MTDEEIAHILKQEREAGGGVIMKDGFLKIEEQLAPQPDVDLERVIKVWNEWILGPDDVPANTFTTRTTMRQYDMDHTQ